MAKSVFLNSQKNFYILGVGGVSMSAIATYLLDLGCTTYGYDRSKSEAVNSLIKRGLKFAKLNPYDLLDFTVVYSSAVENTTYFSEIKKMGVPLIKRSEFLSQIQKSFKINVAVSGCHGKTTSTAMLAHVLNSANMHPTAFIGGEDKVYSNYLKGNGRICVMEACEYKKNFLDFVANVSVVTNVDVDHLDSYDGIDDLKSAFRKFCHNRVCIVNADDENSKTLKGRKTITFGLKGGDYTAKDIIHTDHGATFTAIEKGKPKKTITLNVYGDYNVQNALCVIATARYLKIKWDKIEKGLKSFVGVKRRNENIGRVCNMNAVVDYAHHPSEIASLLSVVDLDKSVVVFQPHTYSRTTYLMDDFVKVLRNVKSLIIYKTYPARENYVKKGSAKSLYLRLIPQMENKIFYACDLKSLKEAIGSFYGTEKVIFVGAGDICQLANKIKDKM